MTDFRVVAAPGVTYRPTIVAITGDRLVHPNDVPNEKARIVQRWGRSWIAYTNAARDFFAARGAGRGDPAAYSDEDVSGWLFLPAVPDSLAAQVRSGELDVATALTVEAQVWPPA